MTFFFDRIIGKEFAIRLRAQGHNIVHLSEAFQPNTKDVVWIPEVAQRGWILVTTDRKIRRRKLEKRALRAGQITAFFCNEAFDGKHAESRWKWLQEHWPSIERQAAKANPGEHFNISLNGQFTKLKDL